jgi:hypothetical protein
MVAIRATITPNAVPRGKMMYFRRSKHPDIIFSTQLIGIAEAGEARQYSRCKKKEPADKKRNRSGPSARIVTCKIYSLALNW